MKMNIKKQLTAICFVIAFISGAAIMTMAQMATGGTYSLDQSVIANGGGQNATGGAFSIDGTIGQSIAGTTSNNSPFAVSGGFWSNAALAPSAASVAVSGRILTPDGNGLQNVRVVLTDSQGNSQAVFSSSFGNYRFDEVAVGETYVISIISRRYTFSPQVIFINDEITELNFSAIENSK